MSDQNGGKKLTEEVKDFRSAYKPISPLKDTGDFDDEFFYGFFGDSGPNGERAQNAHKIEMGDRDGISDTDGKEEGEWREAQLRYGQLKEELDRQIGLGIGFGGFRNKLQEWEEDKERYASRGEIIRGELIDNPRKLSKKKKINRRFRERGIWLDTIET